MKNIDKINVRVYGICIKNNKILTLFENYIGEDLVKLPGGGLELGEGLVECLKREFKEELNLNIKNIKHFYTQEDFLISKFRENEQLLTVYYTVDLENEDKLKLMDKNIIKIEWIPLFSENPFPLPIDRLVFELLIKKLN